MKKLLLLAAVCCLFACDLLNNPDDNHKQHQPEDPATWSPVGKVYVGVDTISYCYMKDCPRKHYCVFYFFSEDSLAQWETHSDDFMDISTSPNYRTLGYTFAYPSVHYLDFHFEFTDTLSFEWDGYNLSFYTK